MDHLDIGRAGEDVAVNFLTKKGFKIHTRNYTRTCGEIDIVAEKLGIVRFVEVKTISRKTSDENQEADTYRPEEQVHAAKLKKVARAAELYMRELTHKYDYQIDVVAVTLCIPTKTAKCRLFEAVL